MDFTGARDSEWQWNPLGYSGSEVTTLWRYTNLFIIIIIIIIIIICKSASRSREITTPAPHNSVFYRPDALPAAQPTASKH